ncbi:MFS transporter [Streptomyces sp. FBKL.4005]|uniref:MFS transporter n=1 Tax=Streptomyces sp. FBKL.4005 TaxID=2015515 RepID=UPI0026C18BA7
MGTTGKQGRRRTRDTYRRVIGLTGPLLPCVSFLGRLPTATVQFGSVLLVARTSGSLGAAGLTGGALALGQVAGGPLVGRLADRHGQRPVVLALSLANGLAVAALVTGALAGLPAPVLALLGAAAGVTVPLVGPLARARLIALARRAGVPESVVGAALSFESTLDELSFVLGPALVGLAAVLAHPAYAMAGAAALVALCGSAFALHPTARATTPAPEQPDPPPSAREDSHPDAASSPACVGPHPDRGAAAVRVELCPDCGVASAREESCPDGGVPSARAEPRPDREVAPARVELCPDCGVASAREESCPDGGVPSARAEPRPDREAVPARVGPHPDHWAAAARVELCPDCGVASAREESCPDGGVTSTRAEPRPDHEVAPAPLETHPGREVAPARGEPCPDPGPAPARGEPRPGPAPAPARVKRRPDGVPAPPRVPPGADRGRIGAGRGQARVGRWRARVGRWRARGGRWRAGGGWWRGGRSPWPRCVPGLLGALALQGAMFGACQAGIAALTGRLGQAEQAGLVYAAMGVMSAVAGLAMAAVPERVGARTRWRLATGAALALSLPLPGTTGLPGLYAVVTVLGVAYAPHLITVFGLLERAVAPSRLAEAMGLATSALVGGQALAVAGTGRLAESHGPWTAFTAASTAAGLAFVLALTVRPTTYASGPENALHARVRDTQPH